MTDADDVQPDDLTGYWAPDPPIRCMRPGKPEPEDTCRPVEIDGEIIRVRGAAEMSDESREALADLIAAAKRKMEAEAPQQIGALQNRLRLAHQARRAKEHQLDDIRRALCDIGFIDDDDPYSHADLADVIRQNGTVVADGQAACIHPDGYEGECPCPPNCDCCRVEAAARTTPDNSTTGSDTADNPLRARIQALADEHPVAIPTHLIDEALDQPAAAPAAAEPDTRYAQAIADVQSSGPAAGHNDGPSIDECSKADRRYWDCEKEGS